jgi:hypothetical protein
MSASVRPRQLHTSPPSTPRQREEPREFHRAHGPSTIARDQRASAATDARLLTTTPAFPGVRDRGSPGGPGSPAHVSHSGEGSSIYPGAGARLHGAGCRRAPARRARPSESIHDRLESLTGLVPSGAWACGH